MNAGLPPQQQQQQAGGSVHLVVHSLPTNPGASVSSYPTPTSQPPQPSAQPQPLYQPPSSSVPIVSYPVSSMAPLLQQQQQPPGASAVVVTSSNPAVSLAAIPQPSAPLPAAVSVAPPVPGMSSNVGPTLVQQQQPPPPQQQPSAPAGRTISSLKSHCQNSRGRA